MNFDQRYDSRLRERKSTGLFRELSSGHGGGVDFTHNDYLCLSSHPEVVLAVQQAVEEFGLGGQASRLLGAEATVARELESLIAESKSEHGQALVLPTGYQLNASVISTLLNPELLGGKPLVFTDRLIHASVHAGIRLSGARQYRFQHNDLEHLESLLSKKAKPDSACFVFVESIYGMDGDRADLEGLYRLKTKYPFFLYVDEAHAVGVSGEEGFGLARQAESIADMVIGTFSKAIGAAGGFLVCSPTIKALLINYAGGLIYSTAPSPAILAGVKAAWQLLPGLEKQRLALMETAQWFREQLRTTGLDCGASDSHIVPVMIGESAQAIQLRERLAAQGFHVACIRPPTVPPQTARLRLSLNVSHTREDLGRLIKALAG